MDQHGGMQYEPETQIIRKRYANIFTHHDTSICYLQVMGYDPVVMEGRQNPDPPQMT